MLLLRLGGRRFLLPLEQVEEINRPLPLTPLPVGPAYLAGLANLRGRVLCVVDPALRMGLTPEKKGVSATKQRFVTLRHAQMHVAMRVDSVEDIYHVAVQAIRGETGHIGASAGGEFVSTSAEVGGERYEILDAGALLC